MKSFLIWLKVFVLHIKKNWKDLKKRVEIIAIIDLINALKLYEK